MELIDYVRLARKWWWLFVVAALVAGGIAYVVSSARPAVYQAQVMLSVGGFIQSPNPDSGDIRTGVDLAQNYAVLARTYEILEAAVAAGQFDLSPNALARMLSTRVVGNTSMLVLAVEYTDPVLAADIANQVALQLILNSPSNLTPAQQSQLDLANAEIEKLNAQLADTRAQLQLVDQQIADASGDGERTLLQMRRDTLLQQINQASSTLAEFSSTVAALQQRTNSLEIVERARIPTAPTGASTLSTTLLGAIVGLALAWGGVLLIEYLDDTLRSPDQVTQAIGLPVVGVVNRFGKTTARYPERLVTLTDPTSAPAESYRTMRTNLLFSAGHGKKQAYIITSVGPQEGKSVTSANLAVTMAAAGLRVLLVDADLRRPKVHQIFELPNKMGLTTLLAAEPMAEHGSLDEAFPSSEHCAECLQSTSVPGLRVITSGFLPSNPTEVLGSALMQQWYRVFMSANNIDVVIFDVPPIMAVSDSVALAAATGAPVILVVEAGKARRHDVLRAKEQLEKLEVKIKGVVLNQVDARDAGYSYNYYYYYSSDTAEPVRANGNPARSREKQR